MRQQLLIITVNKHSYTKTCSSSLYIIESHFKKFMFVKYQFLAQALFLPVISLGKERGWILPQSSGIIKIGRYNKIGGVDTPLETEANLKNCSFSITRIAKTKFTQLVDKTFFFYLIQTKYYILFISNVTFALTAV